VVATQPREPRVVLGVTTASPLVALTFDLDLTPQMASAARAGFRWVNTDGTGYLESSNVRATLFMTGMWAEVYPSEARHLAANPNFEIENHSYSHPAFHSPCYRLGSVSRADQVSQVRLAQRAIQRVTGVTPRYFRFPGGCSNVKPGSIVVMHLMRGNAPATGAALRLIIPALQRKGYQFVTVSELLATGPAIQPTDPREVVDVYQPAPMPLLARRLPSPAPRWCGWVVRTHGRVYICR
jgi:hypothetical protein